MPLQNKPNLILLSSWGDNVSFTIVTKCIISKLENDFNCIVFALDQPPTLQTENVIGCKVGNNDKMNAQFAFEIAITKNPAVIIYFYDLFNAYIYTELLNHLRRFGVKLVAYLPDRKSVV